MAAIAGRIPGIPRWVGARITTTPGQRRGNDLEILVSAKVPPVRGLLYGLWLNHTGRTLPPTREA